jgi:hypothetical protein
MIIVRGEIIRDAMRNGKTAFFIKSKCAGYIPRATAFTFLEIELEGVYQD